MKLSRARLDSSLVEEGVWFDYGAGWRWRIARMSNSKMRQRVETKQGARALASRRRGVDTEREVRKFKKDVAECVALEWEGLEDDDGNLIPFTSAKCLEIFEDPSTEHIFLWVCECAQGEDDYIREVEEEAVGN